MKWFMVILFIQFTMWGAPEEPPDEMEGPGPSEQGAMDTPVGVREICEDNKSQLETFKDIMLKNKSDLKKKEEELQVGLQS